VRHGAGLRSPRKGATLLEDMESELKINCNAKSLREGYLEELNKLLDSMRRGCAKAAIDYALVRTSDPLDAVLASYLSRRMARDRAR